MSSPRIALTQDLGAPPSAYLAQLHAELAVLQKWGADPQARAVLHVIEELTERELGAADEMLTLRAAAAISGYSEDHLGKLVRASSLKNYGRAGAPRVKRGEIPTRPARLPADVPSATVGRSKAAIARAITGSQ